MNTRVYWLLRSSPAGRTIGRWAKPIAVLAALIRAHDYSYPLPSQKRELLFRMAQDFDCREFVETGTFRGDTAAFMAGRGLRCTTIELEPDLAELARRRFEAGQSVRVLEGDSSVILPSVISELREAGLFWLDAHCSSGTTAGGGLAPPLLTELGLVLRDHRFDHCVGIDDARDLLGLNGYPTLTDVAALVSAHRPYYAVRLVADVVLIAPARM
ncbi:MAG: hypothetical protein ACR2LG_06070 [Actinomycetota bacterium]